MWNTTMKHIQIRTKKLGFACSCSFSTLNIAVLEYRGESEDTCGAEFIVHLATQGNEIQTQGFPWNAKGSSVAAPLLPLQSPAASRAQTSARLKLGSSKAEVERKEEAACKVWKKKIMSNYTFTMPVKEATISHAEVASMRVVLDEISSKNVCFLLKLKA